MWGREICLAVHMLQHKLCFWMMLQKRRLRPWGDTDQAVSTATCSHNMALQYFLKSCLGLCKSDCNLSFLPSHLLFAPPSFFLTLSLFALAARKLTEYNRLSKWLRSAYLDNEYFSIHDVCLPISLWVSAYCLEWCESDFIKRKFKYLREKRMVNSDQTWRYKTEIIDFKDNSIATAGGDLVLLLLASNLQPMCCKNF